MRTIIGIIFLVSLVFSGVILADAASSNASFGPEPQVDYLKRKTRKVAHRTKRGTKYTYRKTKRGTRWTAHKTKRGTKTGYRKTKRGTKKVYSKSKDTVTN